MAYTVACHCGQIRFEVEAELKRVRECNCSICSRSGFLHWYVPPEAVTLLTRKARLSTYVWRLITGGQHFCPTCGVAVIRTSTRYPPPVSVNARCIEGVRLEDLNVLQFNGRDLID
jgi:hypothetical protein